MSCIAPPVSLVDKRPVVSAIRAMSFFHIAIA